MMSPHVSRCACRGALQDVHEGLTEHLAAWEGHCRTMQDTFGCHSKGLCVVMQGIGAVSMQWGAWGGTGMAIKNNLLPRIIKSGLGVLAPDAGVAALAAALSNSPNPAQLVISPFEWPKLMQGATHVFPIFSEYATHFKSHSRPSAAATPAAPTQPTAMQRGHPLAFPPQQGAVQAQMDVTKAALQAQRAAVADKVAAVVAGVMGKEVDAAQPLMEAGLDSLGAVELRTSLGQHLELELPATIVFNYPTVSQLASYIAGLSVAAEPAREVSACHTVPVPAHATHGQGPVQVKICWTR